MDNELPLLGLISLASLWIKVPSRFLLIPITLFAAIQISIPFSLWYLGMDFRVVEIILVVSTIGLLSTYLLRFLKTETSVIKYLKLFGIVLFTSIIPVWAYYPMGDFSGSWAYVAGALILAIYIYDRIILQPSEKMKTKFVVVLVGQTALILMFLVYALVQRQQAIINERVAVETQIEARRLAALAEEQQMIAQQNQTQAEKAQAIAAENLKRCMERQRNK